MKFTSKKGFTLIELLVVVAIIGILASIVLVSLNSARAKGRDASAKGSLSSLRAAAEIWYDDHNGSYVGFCVPSTGGAASLLQASDQETGTTYPAKCYDSALQFAAWDQLSTNRYFCVDSSGFAGEFSPTNPTLPLPVPADGSTKCFP